MPLKNHPAKIHILYVFGPQHFGTRNWLHEENIFMDQGRGGIVSGWFKHIAFIVHFISNLMLALTGDTGPKPRDWGLLAVYVLTHHKRRHGPWCCVISCCIQYKSNLIAHRFAPGGLWLKNVETCYLFAKNSMCLSIGIGAYVCILWVSAWHREDLCVLMAFHLWVIKCFIPQE